MTMDPKDRKTEASRGNLPQQDLSEADLAAIQAAYSELEAVEPPALLDQAVLNAARRELAFKRRKPLHWIGAFATASVVVIALTLVIQQGRESMPVTGSNGAKLDAVAPARVQAPAKVQARAKLQDPQEESVAGAFSDTLPVSSLPESRAMESARDDSQLMKQSAAGKRELSAGPEMANQPLATTPEAQFNEAPVGEGKELSADADLRADDVPADTESRERFRDEAVTFEAEPGPSAVQAEKAAAAGRAIGESGQAPGIASATSTEAEQDEAATTLPDPDQWIQRLLLLRQSELDEQLVQELAAFKLAYPDYPLPPELED